MNIPKSGTGVSPFTIEEGEKPCCGVPRPPYFEGELIPACAAHAMDRFHAPGAESAPS